MKKEKTEKNKNKRNTDMITDGNDGTELPMITSLPNTD